MSTLKEETGGEQLRREGNEGAFHIHVGLGRGLHEWDLELGGELLALLRVNDLHKEEMFQHQMSHHQSGQSEREADPLVIHVALVSDQDFVDTLACVLLYVANPSSDGCKERGG